MLKKHAFAWTPHSVAAFEGLKKALITTPVLALPNFNQPFTIECDASDAGIGAVLQQGGHPVAFFSRPWANRHLKFPAYEKELIRLAKAVIHTGDLTYGADPLW